MQQKRQNKTRTGTYKSSSSASLWDVALVISRRSVRGPAVVPWRITWVTVALLRVLHPLSHVFFTSERWRIRGWRGWRGGGGWRAIPLLFTLPMRKNMKAGCEFYSQKRVKAVWMWLVKWLLWLQETWMKFSTCSPSHTKKQTKTKNTWIICLRKMC